VRAERAACGMGFIATTEAQPSHDVVAMGVTALARLAQKY
jgi:glutamate synthase domain-containing protein 1